MQALVASIEPVTRAQQLAHALVASHSSEVDAGGLVTSVKRIKLGSEGPQVRASLWQHFAAVLVACGQAILSTAAFAQLTAELRCS